jgi:glycosyltransferase involved in cell wall biosynthesis
VTGQGEGLVVVPEVLGDLGGTERVLRAVLSLYPAAVVVGVRFDSICAPPEILAPLRNPVRVAGGADRKHHALAPLYARWIAAERYEASIVLSLAHGGWSLAARIPPAARHVCYLAGPPSALYDEVELYVVEERPALQPLARAAVPLLRRYNRRLARRPDRLLTNSRWSADAIERLYGRAAEVVYPPVDTAFFTPTERPREHILAVSRLVANKRIDVLVEAFRGLRDRLVVAGSGPALESLRRNAPPNVHFTGHVTDDELRELYRTSRALVCPSREEFGIVMAEAHACEVPVIAPNAGGALEIVRHRETGLLLDRVDGRSIAEAISALGSTGFDRQACRASAERFAETRFLAAIEAVFNEELGVAERERRRSRSARNREDVVSPTAHTREA